MLLPGAEHRFSHLSMRKQTQRGSATGPGPPVLRIVGGGLLERGGVGTQSRSRLVEERIDSKSYLAS